MRNAMIKFSNFFNKISTFLKQVVRELKKVNWLSRREVLRYTIIVVAVCVSAAIFLGGLDFLFTTLLSKFVL